MIADLPINTVVAGYGPGNITWIKVAPDAWRKASRWSLKRAVIYSDAEVTGEILEWGDSE